MYTKEKLNYLFSDLEPFIDTHTLGLHYNKHYQTYLNNLNTLLKKNNYKFNYSLPNLTNHLDEFPDEDRESIKFNLGGVINHNLYFKSINDKQVLPSGALLDSINDKFGSFDNLKKEFIKAALSIKGSGYTFLTMDKNKRLNILNLSNQDSPYFYGLIPLFTVDMWEHAYYINYENKKDIYLNNFFDIADFTYANNIYNNLNT